MPIYEYECQKCGHRIEKMQSINDKPLSRCPKCKGKLEKQWSQTSFQLKGSGWYVTDYAAKKGEAKPEGATEAKSESESSAKDDKPSAADSGDTAKPAAETKAEGPAKPAGGETKPKSKKSSTKTAD
jgi:putative FmdB family regulatory protein